MFCDIVKVTLSLQGRGRYGDDTAKVTRADVEDAKTVSFLCHRYDARQPGTAWRVPRQDRAKGAQGRKPNTERPASISFPRFFEAARREA